MLTIATLIGIAAFAGVARASAVSNVTVTDTPPSSAAGARTVYDVAFTTSTGPLSGANQITITFEAPTVASTLVNSAVFATGVSANKSVGSCSASGLVVTCGLISGLSIPAGHNVTVELDGITNSTRPSTNFHVAVTTATDRDVATSAAFAVDPGGQISQPTVSLSNQSAGAAGVKYFVAFATSPTGGLSATANSQITITFPSGTNLAPLTNSSVTDTSVTPNAVVGSCSPSEQVATCGLFSGRSIPSGHSITVELDGITNPSTTSAEQARVSTTSDLPSISGSYNIVGTPPPPTVTSMSPSSGPAAGGTAVTLSGSNFGGATVAFGSAPATVMGNTGTQLTVVSPPGAGTVDVTVTTAGGTSAATAVDRFTYNAPPPPPPPPPTTPPAVSGGAPTTPVGNGTTVAGTVDPENLLTTAFFQYGLDPSFRGPGASATLYDQSTPPQQVGSDAANHTITAPLSGLIPGALYHIRLVATNAAGTTFGPDHTFTTAAPPPPPPPVVGKAENAAPVSGQVFVLVNGMFVLLTGAQQIPNGAVIDALHGTVKITTALPGGAGGARDAAAKGRKPKPKARTQSGNFGGAIFKLTQAPTGLANLSLVEGAFNGAPTYATCNKHKAGDPTATAASSRTLQLLHASAHGKFRTSGRYSAATVRGTIWTVADRCDGTLTHDITDSVVVNDFVRHKTIILHAGQSYLAAARRHK